MSLALKGVGRGGHSLITKGLLDGVDMPTPPPTPLSFSDTNFQKQVLRMIDPPVSPQDFCLQFSKYYEQLAMTCVPTPTITGRRALMEKAMLPAFLNPKAGNPTRAINGIVGALPIFWIGVPIPGGAVTAFLGGPALSAYLSSTFTNPKMSLGQVARLIDIGMKNATRMVQYLIPPGPALFLVVP